VLKCSLYNQQKKVFHCKFCLMSDFYPTILLNGLFLPKSRNKKMKVSFSPDISTTKAHNNKALIESAFSWFRYARMLIYFFYQVCSFSKNFLMNNWSLVNVRHGRNGEGPQGNVLICYVYGLSSRKSIRK